MKNNRTGLISAGVFGFLGVALGAFGAHGLRNVLTAEMLEVYKTGITYHLIHAVAILAISLLPTNKLNLSALFFSTGIILFSFSLYLYSYTGVRWLAMITPFGGLSFLAGWILIIVQAIKWKEH